MYSAWNEFERASFEDSEITVQMRSMYYSLLHLCMTKGGIRMFPAEYHFLMHSSKIGGENTYYDTLKKLEDKKFIKYKPGRNRYSTAIITLLFSDSTTSKLKSYWDAISKSTNLPAIKATKKFIGQPTKDIIIIDNIDTVDNKISDIKDPQNRQEARAVSNLFEQFWAAYGKDVNKTGTKKEWGKLTHELQVKILDYVPKYVQSKPNKVYRKNPVNFLTENTWEDEIIITKNNENNEPRRIFDKIGDYTEETF